MCLVCGVDNPYGLHACFYVLEGEGPRAGEAPAGSAAAAPGDAAAAAFAPPAEPATAELLGVFTPRPEHQSYPGRLHGGIASAILDETIGRAILIAHPDLHVWGVTGELTVRFLAPVPLDGDVRAVARITRDTRLLFEGTGEILLDDGTVAAKGHGKYLKMTLDAVAPEFDREGEWLADTRELPKEIDL